MLLATCNGSYPERQSIHEQLKKFYNMGINKLRMSEAYRKKFNRQSILCIFLQKNKQKHNIWQYICTNKII